MRVYTSKEYEAMGYVQRDDYNSEMFRDGSYSSMKWDINFLDLPVYRAETKTEFMLDGLFLAGAFFTGGSSGGLRYASSKLEIDN
jgi:hypothetical protein